MQLKYLKQHQKKLDIIFNSIDNSDFVKDFNNFITSDYDYLTFWSLGIKLFEKHITPINDLLNRKNKKSFYSIYSKVSDNLYRLSLQDDYLYKDLSNELYEKYHQLVKELLVCVAYRAKIMLPLAGVNINNFADFRSTSKMLLIN